MRPILIESQPTCPACQHEMTTDEMVGHDEDLFAIAPDEGRVEIVCPGCGVTYHCQGFYQPQYKTALSDDDL